MGRGKSALVYRLVISLAIGIMLGGVGTAIWPPMSSWAAPIVCSGTLDVQSDYYTTQSGGSGVSRHLLCRSGTGKDQEADDVTMMAIGVAGLTYAALVFLILQLLALRRPAEPAAVASFGTGFETAETASSPEVQAILGQVTEALRRGDAQVHVRNVSIEEGEGGDIAQRLALLKQVREAGLISESDYEAKKAELISRL